MHAFRSRPGENRIVLTCRKGANGREFGVTPFGVRSSSGVFVRRSRRRVDVRLDRPSGTLSRPANLNKTMGIARDDVRRIEYDWLAADSHGHLALCSTAGSGQIPKAVLEGEDDHLSLQSKVHSAVLSLPVITEAHAEGKGPGTCSEFLEFARRGLFVFDFELSSGRYQRILRPTTPLTMDLTALPAVIINGICFDENDAFKPEAFLPSE